MIFKKKTAALQIKLKTAIPPLYDRFIEKFPSRDCDLHFINGILGVETLRILYPFIFEQSYGTWHSGFSRQGNLKYKDTTTDRFCNNIDTSAFAVQETITDGKNRV